MSSSTIIIDLEVSLNLNKIKFQVADATIVEDINNIISKCCLPLKLWLTIYHKNEFIRPGHTYEFQVSNTYQHSVSVSPALNFLNENDLDYLISQYKLIYFKNGNNVIKDITGDEKFKDYYTNSLGQIIPIYRSIETFHQTNESLRPTIYKLIANNNVGTLHNILLIGGECYLYGRLLPTTPNSNIEVYSDYQSILDDALYNMPGVKTHLIDYKTISLEYRYNNASSTEIDCVILNVGKSGLGEKLCSELIDRSSLIKQMWYISCNEKSFKRDNAILLSNNNFKLNNRWIIKNNQDSFQLTINLYMSS